MAAVVTTPDFVRPHLGDREESIVRAVTHAMLAGEVEEARLETIVHEVDLYLGTASTFLRFGLRVLLFIVGITPLLLFLSPKRIDRLDLDHRIELLGRLERMRFAPLSLAFIAWRTIILLVAYDDAQELVRLGYVHEHKRHKRHLALMQSGPRLIAPIPLESGVRLKDDETPSVPSVRSGPPERGAA